MSFPLSDAAKGNIATTAGTTAGARISGEVANALGTKGIAAVQRINQGANFVAGLLGLDSIQDIPMPLMGGYTMAEARAIYEEIRDANLTRKNLFRIEIVDLRPPTYPLPKGLTRRTAAQRNDPLSTAIGTLQKNPLDAINRGVSKAVTGALNSLFGLGGDAARATRQTNVPYIFNLFATNVTLPEVTLTGEKKHLGSAVADHLMGSDAIELSITTMDDEVGSLKRWFRAKAQQAARPDGSFGTPEEYCVRINIYSATPMEDGAAYQANYLYRPASMQYDLARGEQAMSEVQLTFSQFDTFSKL